MEGVVEVRRGRIGGEGGRTSRKTINVFMLMKLKKVIETEHHTKGIYGGDHASCLSTEWGMHVVKNRIAVVCVYELLLLQFIVLSSCSNMATLMNQVAI